MKKNLLILFFLLGSISFTTAQKQPAQSGTPTTPKAAVVRYFPNPATTHINFEFQNSFPNGYSVIVYNLMGKEVMSVKKLSVFTSLNIESLYRGMYIFKLLNEKGVILQSGKFQVLN